MDSPARRTAQWVVRRPDAHAEVWQYVDPGHPDHGTWAFQLLDRPWTMPMDNERDGHIVDCPASDIAYPSWREAFDAAFRATDAARFPLINQLRTTGTFLGIADTVERQQARP